MKLQRLQELLFARIRGPEDVSAEARSALQTMLVSDDKAEAEARLGIYAGMYLQRLVSALHDDHPALRGALGGDFDGLARDYVRACPSRNPSLRQLGVGLAAYLEERGLDWQADLCRLERARIEMFDGPPDAEPLDRAELQRVAAEDDLSSLRLSMVPASIRLGLRHRVTPRWAGYLDGAAAPAPPEAEVVLVWRQGVEVFHAALDADEDAALGWLSAGDPLGVVFERLAERLAGRGDDRDPTQLAFALLGRWLDDGLVLRPTMGIMPADGGG